ncbi:transglycosylase SLT domain-containing protein [Halomonas sp. EGI 63088]|uniref:Transglycosylase SLT domain-containing protein n=1 Tax=Halomonas flagellata TaxID=2920385 RepID=A0ABS9RTY1_9GAMM|nr:transglycosylase SLT domain-containing protein [Halomonas flagellata]MCH4563290.1 transglycosylase SLT domain-containing protein [Halomonas flagellata]
MLPSFGHCKALIAATLCCLPLLVQADDRAMRDALEAARNQEWQKIDQAAIDDHLLAGYVEYHRLRNRLPQAEPARVLDFIERHDDSPLGEWMRGQAIARYGHAGRFGSLLAVADGVPEGTARQCYYYTALLGGDPGAAAEGGRELWRVGRSQPDACDTLFRALRSRGEIGEREIWERKMLAWQAGETGLMSYLGRMLGNRWQEARDTVERLQKDYAAVTRVPTCIGPDCQGSRALFTAAMHGFTRADTEAAHEAWRKIAPHLELDEPSRLAIERDLVFYSLVRDIRQNRAWVDEALVGMPDAELLELRVRTALAERDWRGVIDWIHRMPDEPRQEARWQYWLGRALEQRGDTATAETAYAAAADDRSFFGFAAADRLGRPYALNLERNGFDDGFREQVARWPAVQRTEALIRIGEQGLANSEWHAAVARATPREARALADYAQRRGWHAKLVQTTITGQMWDALDWRFPEAYREHFLHWGRATGVDPYLLMGIARRESAYNPEALSPAGARGLMQVMPGTATQLSRQLGISDPGPHGVLDPALNIRLGSTYIRDMLDRYRGNRLAATAAYNAGPGRVDRWLRDAPEEFDLFVESIPFRETRAYVQAVLAYRAIFESLANGGNSEGVAMLSPAETSVRYDRSLLARN